MNLLIELPQTTASQMSYTVTVNLNEACERHHKTLFFCWNIRAGIDKGVDIQRIVDYVNWYGEKVLFKKFEIEENYLFSLLDEDHYLVKRALKEHRRLRRLFKIDVKNPMKSLIYIEEELDLHIRFEEKQMFPEFEKNATQKKLKVIKEQFNSLLTNTDWKDQFWL
ncbi:hemerythrin domain-containing protein [Empedobacter sp.]|uniref:hemerythrin domain-containing protein n=1 Tax=Empedobacter sp. TaxID=1927715 RepID=UPI000E8474D3|nr:hemerythrin domain-containing protein [Empedobacter sp.]HBX62470.1 cation-binding protein [Flavobacteriaceae bacterium]